LRGGGFGDADVDLIFGREILCGDRNRWDMNKTATIGKLRLSKVWTVRVKVAIPPRSFSSRRAVLAAGRIVLCKRAIFSLLSLIAWGRCAGQGSCFATRDG